MALAQSPEEREAGVPNETHSPVACCREVFQVLCFCLPHFQDGKSARFPMLTTQRVFWAASQPFSALEVPEHGFLTTSEQKTNERGAL